MRTLLALVIVLSQVGKASAAEEFDVEVRRTAVTAKAVFGEMYVNDHFLCYTLEPPIGGGPKNKGPIPAGTYSGSLRYDHSDRWRIELKDVPGFTYIQIHKGNDQADTAGCILVGMEKDEEGGKVLKSDEAYKKLKAQFYGSETPNATPNKTIKITVRGSKGTQ